MLWEHVAGKCRPVNTFIHICVLQVSGPSDIPDYLLVHCINYDNKKQTNKQCFFAEQFIWGRNHITHLLNDITCPSPSQVECILYLCPCPSIPVSFFQKIKQWDRVYLDAPKYFIFQSWVHAVGGFQPYVCAKQQECILYQSDKGCVSLDAFINMRQCQVLWQTSCWFIYRK